MSLHVTIRGDGPPIIFVHGSLSSAKQAWSKQLDLATRWSLMLVERRGYEPNPVIDHSDFEEDGADIAELLDGAAHLVGHSYGALGAMVAAALRPADVRSLTLIEAPAFSLVRGDPMVEAQIAGHEGLLRTATNPREFYLGFVRQIGASTEAVPDPLSESLERLVRLLMCERLPWDGTLPVAALRDAAVPVLVVSGGWDEVIES